MFISKILDRQTDKQTDTFSLENATIQVKTCKKKEYLNGDDLHKVPCIFMN